jgi:hypothetical protein
MVARTITCCTVLIVGLLVILGATAQSAGVCNGTGCRSAGTSGPLDLMTFMRGGAKAAKKTTAKPATTKTSKQRRGATRSAARSGKPPIAAAPPQPAALPATAASAYASQDGSGVEVVASDQLNAIDLAMPRNATETIGAAQKPDADVSADLTSADAGQARDAGAAPGGDKLDMPAAPDMAAAPAEKPASQNSPAPRDESWMGRMWSAIGDGFVALIAMVRQLFA